MSLRRGIPAAALLILVYAASAIFLAPVAPLKSAFLHDDVLQARTCWCVIGFLTSTPALLAIGGAIGHASERRWPFALWLASVFGLLLAYGEFRSAGSADIEMIVVICVASPAAFVVGQFPWLMSSISWRMQRVGLKRRGIAAEVQDSEATAQRGNQITLRQLLLWTAGIASILAGVRWLLPATSLDDPNVRLDRMLVFGLETGAGLAVNTFFVDILAWCMLMSGCVRPRRVVAACMIAFSVGCGLLMWKLSGRNAAIGLWCLIAGMVLSALMTSFVAWTCGCRFIGGTRTAPFAIAHDVPRTPRSSFVASLIPPLALAMLLGWCAPRRIELWRQADEVQRWAAQNIGVSFDDGKLSALWCGEGVHLTDKRLMEFATLSDLTLLDLSGTNIDDHQLTLLLPLQKLKGLSLGRTNVTNEGLKVLSRLPKLQTLHLEMTEITDDGIDALLQIEGLEDVDLTWSAVTESGTNKLREAKWRNTRRSIPIGWYCADGGFKDLAAGRWRHKLSIEGQTHTTIAPVKRLHASSKHVTDVGLRLLSSFTELEDLDLRDSRVTDQGLLSLYGLANLKKLDLRRTAVTIAGIKPLQQALPRCEILPPFDVDDATGTVGEPP